MIITSTVFIDITRIVFRGRMNVSYRLDQISKKRKHYKAEFRDFDQPDDKKIKKIEEE